MRDDIFIRTCKMCGKEFIACRPNTQFCGRVCYNSYRDFQRKLLRHPVENVDAWRYHMTYFLRLATQSRERLCVRVCVASVVQVGFHADDDDAALWLHGWGYPSREADGKEHESSCRKADELAVEYHDLRG